VAIVDFWFIKILDKQFLSDWKNLFSKLIHKTREQEILESLVQLDETENMNSLANLAEVYLIP
jgi:hypothetical protein